MEEAPATPDPAMASAVRILLAEHESLGGVVRALHGYVEPLRAGLAKPSPTVFATVFSYIETFADRFHHPKEDEFLFSALRGRTDRADAVLLGLQHEHAAGPEELVSLREALARTQGGDPAAIAAFADQLEGYARAQAEHIRVENRFVIPLAKEVLLPSDWERIDQAFREHRDPFFGPGADGTVRDLLATESHWSRRAPGAGI